MLFGNNGRVDNSEQELTVEDQSLLVETMLLEGLNPEELEEFLEDHADVNSALDEEILTERTIVRLDRQARLSHLQRMATFTIAREKGDPMFKKLLTVWRMERYLEAFLFRKYGNEAMRRARQSMNTAKSSKSNAVKRVASRVNNQLNMTNARQTINKERRTANPLLSKLN